MEHKKQPQHSVPDFLKSRIKAAIDARQRRERTAYPTLLDMRLSEPVVTPDVLEQQLDQISVELQTIETKINKISLDIKELSDYVDSELNHTSEQIEFLGGLVYDLSGITEDGLSSLNEKYNTLQQNVDHIDRKCDVLSDHFDQYQVYVDDRFEQTIEQVENIQGQVHDIESKVIVLSDDFIGLSNRVQNYEGEFRGIVDELSENFETLRSSTDDRFNEISGKIEEIKSDLRELGQLSDTVTLLVSQVEGNYQELLGKIESLEQSYIDLWDKISTIEGNVDSIFNEIDNIQYKIGQIDIISSDLSTLHSRMLNFEEWLRSLSEDVARNYDDFSGRFRSLANVAWTGSYNDLSDIPEIPPGNYPVSSVNGKVGHVVLSASDVSAVSLAEFKNGFTEWACDPAEYTFDGQTYRFLAIQTGSLIDLALDPEPTGTTTFTTIPTVVLSGATSFTAIGTFTKTDSSNDTYSTDVRVHGSRVKLRPTAEQEAAWNAKQDAVSGVPGNLAGFDSNGALVDSGNKPDDFATKADVSLTPVYTDETIDVSDWNIVGLPDGANLIRFGILQNPDEEGGVWILSFQYRGTTVHGQPNVDDLHATIVTFTVQREDLDLDTTVTATRKTSNITGYQLGSQEDKLLQPAGDYALRSDVEEILAQDYVRRPEFIDLSTAFETFQPEVNGRLDDLQRQVLELSSYHSFIPITLEDDKTYIVGDNTSSSLTITDQTGPATVTISAYDADVSSGESSVDYNTLRAINEALRGLSAAIRNIEYVDDINGVVVLSSDGNVYINSTGDIILRKNLENIERRDGTEENEVFSVIEQLRKMHDVENICLPLSGGIINVIDGLSTLTEKTRNMHSFEFDGTIDVLSTLDSPKPWIEDGEQIYWAEGFGELYQSDVDRLVGSGELDPNNVITLELSADFVSLTGHFVLTIREDREKLRKGVDVTLYSREEDREFYFGKVDSYSIVQNEEFQKLFYIDVKNKYVNADRVKNSHLYHNPDEPLETWTDLRIEFAENLTTREYEVFGIEYSMQQPSGETDSTTFTNTTHKIVTEQYVSAERVLTNADLVEIYNEFEQRDSLIGKLSVSIQEENVARDKFVKTNEDSMISSNVSFLGNVTIDKSLNKVLVNYPTSHSQNGGITHRLEYSMERSQSLGECIAYMKHIGYDKVSLDDIATLVEPAVLNRETLSDNIEYIETEVHEGYSDSRLALTKIDVVYGNAGNIPSYIDGYGEVHQLGSLSVTLNEGDDQFKYCLHNVDLGGDSYGNFFNSEQINIPDTVQAIGDYAFSHIRSRVESIVVPDSVTEIGKMAFHSSTGIASVKLPRGLKVIPEGLFANCYNLETIELPETLESIGANAFADTKFNGPVYIDENIKYINYDAFFNCPINSLYWKSSGNPESSLSMIVMTAALEYADDPDYGNLSDTIKTIYYPCDVDTSTWPTEICGIVCTRNSNFRLTTGTSVIENYRPAQTTDLVNKEYVDSSISSSVNNTVSREFFDQTVSQLMNVINELSAKLQAVIDHDEPPEPPHEDELSGTFTWTDNDGEHTDYLSNLTSFTWTDGTGTHYFCNEHGVDNPECPEFLNPDVGTFGWTDRNGTHVERLDGSVRFTWTDKDGVHNYPEA